MRYLARKVMMPRTGSYGDTPTVTRSPGTTLMRKRRIRPLSWASTSWPASHCTRYSPPLWTATTVPCMSIKSSLLNQLAFLSSKQLVCHIAAAPAMTEGQAWLPRVPGGACPLIRDHKLTVETAEHAEISHELETS